MTELDFQTRVIEDLATIKEQMASVCRIVNGHHGTLYGGEGRGGLVGDLAKIQMKQIWWYRILGIVGAAAGVVGAYLKWGTP